MSEAMKQLHRILSHWAFPILVFAVASLLGATMHPLWGDEAETALFGRNIVSYGVPKGWDGVNIMGINNAVVLDKNLINHTSPWGQYYLVAASFALFGQSAFTARLPFIVLSLLSMLIVYRLVIDVTKDKTAAYLSLWIIALSVPYILFSYQARYYALNTCCALLMAHSAYHMYRKSGRMWMVWFALGGSVFFYGNYVVFAAFYAAIVLTILAAGIRTKRVWPLFRSIALSTIPILVFTVPWYILLKPFDSRGTIASYTIPEFITYFGMMFLEAVKPFNQNNALPLLFLAAIGIFLSLKSRRINKTILFFLGIGGLFLTVMTLFTLLAEVDTSFVHIRYTMMIFPFLAIASSLLISHIYSLHKWIGLGVFLLYIGTTLFSLTGMRSYIIEFAQERISPYKTPDEVVSEYLQEFASEGDTAFVSLDRDHEPLIFDLGKKIRFVNRVSLVNTRIFPENRGLIPRYIYDFRDLPDWVILYSKRENDGSFAVFDHRKPPVEFEMNKQLYKETVLPVYFSDMTRPELELRSFNKINPKPEDMVYIYRKI